VRELPALTDADREVPGGQIAFAILVVAWIVILAMYLSHTIVPSSDSLNNHVHVWYIARDLWHHGRVPWKMPVLGHGDAYAYPYGSINWTTAALVWPLLGDRGVTLWTALGTVGCIVATFVAFPELRRGWWAAAVLANSALLQSLLFGQQSFSWGAALLLFGVACWRRGRRGWAAVLVGLGQLTHPAVVAPMGLVLVLLYLPFTRDRWAVVRWYALSCLITLPGVALVFASPGFSDTSVGSRVVNFWVTLGPRVLIVVLPLFYAVLRRTGVRALGPLALAVSLVFTLALEEPMNVAHEWRALRRRTVDTTELDAYFRTPAFVSGATYRLLRDGDAKVGIYHLLRAGGRLDSEMFPESMAMRNFRDIGDYEALLCARHVDQVLHFASYDRQRRTNEHALLDQLVARPGSRISAHVVTTGPDWQAYAIDRSRCDQDA
jgi:hypothetical protein